MRPNIRLMGDHFVYSCTFDEAFAYEQFVPEHVLVYQIAGETQIYQRRREIVLKEGQFLLAQRNQFAKSVKLPRKNKEYKCMSVVLSSVNLRKYALDNGIVCETGYEGRKNILLGSDKFLKGYFDSVLPYLDEGMSKKLALMKVYEAIELLLALRPNLRSFLFGLLDPGKEDLEAFMNKNFHYNAPLENFARLSGRSLTSFKRDFAHTFHTSPAKWLKEKRLSEAYYLIQRKNRKPKDIYVRLGFENLSHFYTAFKQKFGITPAELIIKTKTL